MFYGTRITFGLQDWQILQADSAGVCAVSVGGVWRLQEGAIKAGVSGAYPSCRLAREEDNSYLTDWIRADLIDEERWESVITVPRGGLYRLETCLDIVFAKVETEVLTEARLTDMAQETDVYTKEIDAVIGLIATIVGCGLRIVVATEVV